MSSYTPAFFAETRDVSLSSARVVLDRVWSLLAPRTPARVIDVGCGVGAWASTAIELGATAVGVDGDYVRRESLLIPSASFIEADLSTPGLKQVSGAGGAAFDLAICMEVAEHLSPARADSFVEELCALSPLVLFSAAVPGQGGTEHVNEQWPAYWAERFARHGYRSIDALRTQLLSDNRVAWWYAQNALIFAKADAMHGRPGLEAAALNSPTIPGALTHATLYNQSLKRSRRPGKTFLYDLRSGIKKLVKGR
ncbi:MAG: class I SAM-dependent methyltransferase [Phycisphaerales bacterium]|nr:class I SAM-dependent methyltransferase [Phycisphaerales bacterium]